MKIFIEPYIINWKKLLSKICKDVIDSSTDAELVITSYSNFENFQNKSSIILAFSKNDIEKFKALKGSYQKLESVKLFDNLEFLKLGTIELEPNDIGIHYKNKDDLLMGVIRGNKLYSNILFSEIHKAVYSTSIIKIFHQFLKEMKKIPVDLFPKFSKREWKAIERIINYNIELGSQFQNLKSFLRIAETNLESKWLTFFIKEEVFELDKSKENIRLAENAPRILESLAENSLELKEILGD